MIKTLQIKIRRWHVSCCTVPGTANPVCVLIQWVDEALTVNAPHFDRLVIRCCHQSMTIMGESDAANSCGVSFENGRLSFPKTYFKKREINLGGALLQILELHLPLNFKNIFTAINKMAIISGVILHGWCPQTHCSVFGWGCHQVTRGRELNSSDAIVVTNKTESSGLRSQIPNHKGFIYWPRSWRNRKRLNKRKL